MRQIGRGNSAYSKMYLVTPSVYEKLLTVIDDKEKRVIEELNTPPETISDRPSEKILQNLSNVDIGQTAETEMQPSETGQPEVISEQAQEMQNVEQPAQQFVEVQPTSQAIELEGPPVTQKTKEPQIYTCPYCHKVFTRLTSVNRHIERSHTSIQVSNIVQQPLPVVSTAEMNPSRITAVKTRPKVIFASDEETPIMSDLERVPIPMSKRKPMQIVWDDDYPQPNLRKNCAISSDNTERCIPNVSLQEPIQSTSGTQKPQLIMPNIMLTKKTKKSSILKPSISKRKPPPKLKTNTQRKVTLKLPAKKKPVEKEMEIGDFENWSQTGRLRKRTASDAKLRMKNPKKVPKQADFERWEEQQ
jgi:hypothetical protein